MTTQKTNPNALWVSLGKDTVWFRVPIDWVYSTPSYALIVYKTQFKRY